MTTATAPPTTTGGTRRAFDLRRVPLPLLLAPLAFVPALASRAGVFGDDVWFNAGVAVCYAAAGLSLNLLMGYAGQISLGQFTLLGVGAFTSGWITGADRLALPFMLAVPAAALAGAVVALVIGIPALRLRGLYLAVVTIAFTYAAQLSVFKLHAISRGSAGVELPRPQIDDFIMTRNADYLVVLLLLLAGLWLFDRGVTGSKVGRAFHAIKADEAVASSFGVDVARYKLLAFVLSGAVAGVAGAMYAHLFQFANSETFPFERSLLLVVIVVVGGLGNRLGVLIAAAFYALWPIYVVKLFGAGFRGTDLILGAALLMFTVARHPGGLAEAWGDGAERRRARRAVGTVAKDAADDDDDGAPLPNLPELPRPSGLPERHAAATTAGAPVLRATGVSVRFGGLQALRDASIEVGANRIVGLIGPNGAGKTTLFNAVSGLLRPDSGRVELLGEDITALPAHARARKGIGRTFQLIGLARDLSVTENLLLAQHVVAGYSVGSALTRIGSANRVERELRSRAADAIDALGFGQYAHTPVKRLSHGQQRIVELGCALVTAPELVLLDEPSAGMSPGAAENLAVRLRDMRDELGRTVLLIEHNIPLVLDVCDELYVLAGGELLARGEPDEVVRRPAVIEAYLGRGLERGREREGDEAVA
jgi:ABC-type branched-subunit amino acid transport system ATPase component/ABC-type branched-subunit amino acid transport system permease subunit